MDSRPTRSADGREVLQRVHNPFAHDRAVSKLADDSELRGQAARGQG